MVTSSSLFSATSMVKVNASSISRLFVGVFEQSESVTFSEVDYGFDRSGGLRVVGTGTHAP